MAGAQFRQGARPVTVIYLLGCRPDGLLKRPTSTPDRSSGWPSNSEAPCATRHHGGAFMSTPPGQGPGASGHQRGAPQQATPPRKRAWPRRHPIWSAVIAVFAIFVLLVIIGSVASPPSTPTSHTAAVPTPTPTPTPAVVPATVAVPPACQALASSRRPRDHTTVTITISTVAHARVAATGPLALANGERARGRADASGLRTVRFRIGDATPGVRVTITVRVSRHGRKGTCRTSLRPRKVKPVQVTAPPAPSSPAAAPPPTATSCYPRSDSGTCYRPGEFCRTSDHGLTGVAGDGEKIICEDNNGWRWEPA